MAKLSKIQRCYHCGEILQTEDETKEGYINPDILNKYPEGFLLCNHCFSVEKFSKEPKEASFDDEYYKILGEIKANNALVVYVVNLFSFEGSFINKIIDSLKDIDIIVVGNKKDLLPVEADDQKVKNYVLSKFKHLGLNIIDIVLTSTVDKTAGIDEMYDLILKNSKNRDVYFVGASESGKTALIETLLKKYSNNTKNVVSLHKFTNTDIVGFSIPITNKTYIYETPGTSIDNSVLSHVDRQSLNLITPKVPVVERKVLLTKNTAILFGSICQIELVSDHKTWAHIYMSKDVDIKTHKFNNDAYFKKQVERNKYFPKNKNNYTFKNFDIYEIEVDQLGKYDIGISGLGWISIDGNSQILRIAVPKGVYVYTSYSKI